MSHQPKKTSRRHGEQRKHPLKKKDSNQVQPEVGITSDVDYLLLMQKTVGNQAVNRLIQEAGTSQVDSRLAAANKFHVPDKIEGSLAVQRADEMVDTAKTIFEEGEQFYNEGDYRAAIIRFERARQMPGMSRDNQAMIHFNIGLSNFKLRRFATAVYNFEQYINAGVGSEQEQDQARQMLQRSRDGAGVPAEMSEEEQRQTFEDAEQYYASSQFRKAIVRFERVRQAGNLGAASRAILSFNIGLCNIRLRRFATAIPYFEEYIRSLGHDPNSTQTHEAAQGNADLREALDLLRQARQGAEMPWARLLYYQATEKYEAGNYSEAVTLFQQLMGMPDLDSSQSSMIFYNAGMSLHRLSRFSEAVTYYQRYLTTEPSEQDRVKAEAQIEQARNNAPPITD